MKTPYVYIMSNRYRGTMYTGVTSDLPARVSRHKLQLDDGFTSRYGLHRLVWFEVHTEMNEAMLHETRIKRWRREWKFELIEKLNADWRDLYRDITENVELGIAGFPLSRE